MAFKRLDPGCDRRDVLGDGGRNADHSVPVSMEKIARTDFQSANLHRTAEFEHVIVGA